MSAPVDGAQQQTLLLAWYGLHKRALPWRTRPTPYGVLVSELMLQQTRVETVLDYYDRWMVRWPTLGDLAAADLQDVLAQWTGLGYYNRARNLHKAAQIVAQSGSSELPADAATLGKLPGLGPYTLGAVRSIAFGQPAALVDGNVARVLARWHAREGSLDTTAAKRWLWQSAEAALAVDPARRAPGDWNQALMELGATLCTPRRPACERCPVQASCAAFGAGLQASIPQARVRAAPQTVAATYALVQRDGLILLGRRPAKGRWAGLWEPPGSEGAGAGVRMGAWLRAAGLRVDRALPNLVHVLTHRRYEVESLLATAETARDPELGRLGYVEQRWMLASQALSSTSGLSRLGQRLVEQVAGTSQSW